MKDDMYKYLYDFGFNNDDISEFEDLNTELYYVSLNTIKNNIEFLLDKGLTKEETIELIKINPYMLTCENNRKDAYNEIYVNVLKLENNEIKNLLLSNSDIYTSSPIELNKIIDYLKNKNHNIEKIKQIIINNPRIITAKLEKFKDEM